MAGNDNMCACIHGHVWPSAWMAAECDCMPDVEPRP